MKVFLAFFFFLGCAFVVAHRIDWYGNATNRGISDLAGAIDDVVSLLNGAISDRGCAIEAMRCAMDVAFVSRFRPAIRESQERLAVFGPFPYRRLLWFSALVLALCRAQGDSQPIFSMEY